MHYSSGRMALGRTQVGTDLGLHLLGNPRACVPSRQLQTMLEHHPLASAQLILHGGRRLVVSGHSQSLQPTGLGKSLLLTCQQQSSLNYKRWVYSAHSGTPRVPRVPNKMEAKRPTPRHIIIKMPKVKERILKAAKEVSYLQGSSRKTVS